jgi:hypothetical protein
MRSHVMDRETTDPREGGSMPNLVRLLAEAGKLAPWVQQGEGDRMVGTGG